MRIEGSCMFSAGEPIPDALVASTAVDKGKDNRTRCGAARKILQNDNVGRAGKRHEHCSSCNAERLGRCQPLVSLSVSGSIVAMERIRRVIRTHPIIPQ